MPLNESMQETKNHHCLFHSIFITFNHEMAGTVLFYTLQLQFTRVFSFFFLSRTHTTTHKHTQPNGENT
ncbi:hypothetical protein Ppha_2058 [Pelodictyon phaeoclathratiforme BU-1]|uniref:Uncharacterized protein n=1 Tax=Pelodictyon phaeoclathratiforme (strain DSM 5477 / BU-1) TaxID=324925 RepID=B4SCR0_PELPB|nr:hypothetical protein Ppha_2058 [Pelodictyon phaeoclathratiforme BU-1]